LITSSESPSSLESVRTLARDTARDTAIGALRESFDWKSGRWSFILGDGFAVRWSVLLGAAFLVSVPVFFQAPLVRSLPTVSLVGTIVWVWLSLYLSQRSTTRVWGELVAGFSWSWLAGSLYWGWLRAEPLWHLPVEALALPLALWGLKTGWCRIGVWFYLGSLFGTTVTDVYFYLLDLTGAWRRVMADSSMAEAEFSRALGLMNSPLGYSAAAVLLSLLVGVGIWCVRRRSLEAWACGGAILSTLVVDGLFWAAALVASR
jgi:Protein of unknown function (DUF3120)